MVRETNRKSKNFLHLRFGQKYHLLKILEPLKSRFMAILGVFRLETAVHSRVTKMAITRFRGSKTRGTFDHRMRNFLLFVFVSRNIC